MPRRVEKSTLLVPAQVRANRPRAKLSSLQARAEPRKPMLSGPPDWRAARRPATTVSKASSHPAGCSRPSRRSMGCVIRWGLIKDSKACHPRRHRRPGLARLILGMTALMPPPRMRQYRPHPREQCAQTLGTACSPAAATTDLPSAGPARDDLGISFLR
jgi:hypothetical protein